MVGVFGCTNGMPLFIPCMFHVTYMIIPPAFDICFITLQMSEQMNQELSLTGKIPSGLFNTMFEFSGCWQKDAANTKTLAFDGMFITLYSVALEKSHMVLRDHVKKEVPSTWDPASLARYA